MPLKACRAKRKVEKGDAHLRDMKERKKVHMHNKIVCLEDASNHE